MMQDIKVRSCRTDDIPQVMKLLNQLAEIAHTRVDFDLQTLQGIFDEMGKKPDIYFNQVAIHEGVVVGFVSVIFYKTLFHRGGTALINELVVDRHQRGLGIGKTLVDSVVIEAQHRGMDEVEVGTGRDNVSAQQFYQKCGFDEEYVLLGMEFSQKD